MTLNLSRLTCTVPEAASALGIGRDQAYRAVAAGEIPSIRIGRRLLVPVPKLLELVGYVTQNGAGPRSPATAAQEPEGALSVDATHLRSA